MGISTHMKVWNHPHLGSHKKQRELETGRETKTKRAIVRCRLPALTRGVIMESVSHVVFVLAFKAASCSHLMHYACSRTLLDRERGRKCDSMSVCDSVSSPQAHFCMSKFLRVAHSFQVYESIFGVNGQKSGHWPKIGILELLSNISRILFAT